MTTKDEQALRDTWNHINLVMKLLASAQIELMRRQFTHDRSKLDSPEWEMFAVMTDKLANLTYGSPEYEAQRKEMLSTALGHHYEHNRHHPEFFESRECDRSIEDHLEIVRQAQENDSAALNDNFGYEQIIEFLEQKQAEHTSSINNMNLFDILEMFIDWNAAVRRHKDGAILRSIEVNQKRFAISPQLVEIFRNTVEWVQDEFEDLKTQKDLIKK